MKKLHTDDISIAYDSYLGMTEKTDTPHTVIKFLMWTGVPFQIIKHIVQERDGSLSVTDTCYNRIRGLASDKYKTVILAAITERTKGFVGKTCFYLKLTAFYLALCTAFAGYLMSYPFRRNIKNDNAG